jgi:hypothetical protein
MAILHQASNWCPNTFVKRNVGKYLLTLGLPLLQMVTKNGFQLPCLQQPKRFSHQPSRKKMWGGAYGKLLMKAFQKHMICLHFWSPLDNGGVLDGDPFWVCQMGPKKLVPIQYTPTIRW